MMKVMAVVLAMTAPAVASGQATTASTPVAQAAPDPARLTAARALIDELMPPATREQMIGGMIQPMLANIQQGMTENPQFAAAMGSDPRVKAIVDRFMQRQFAQTTEMMRTALPGMVTAMAAAYARRFEVAQLDEIRAFFRTPTGRAYMQASMTIMADPDIAAWQRQMMAGAMGRVQADAEAVTREIAALSTAEKP